VSGAGIGIVFGVRPCQGAVRVSFDVMGVDAGQV
jgi:hypothetical protein